MSLFKFWFNKKPLALPKPDSAADPLRADFAAARYGNSCRTLTLAYPYNTTLPVYRHALGLGADRGWRILEITGAQPEANLPPRSAVVGDKLDFFSAIQHLAEWQEGQIKLGFTVDRAEADKLGIAYFVPFGERENIAFDNLNQPHPTVQGEVATSGYFTDEARERAKASIGLPALRTEMRDLFQLFMSRPASETHDLDTLVADAQYHAALRDILDIFQEINKVLTYIFEYKLVYNSATNKLRMTTEDFWRAGNLEQTGGAFLSHMKYCRFIENCMGGDETPETYLARRLEQCKYIYKRLDLAPEGKAGLDDICNAYQIVFHSLASKYLFQLSREKAASKYGLTEEAANYLKKSEELFRKSYAPENETYKLSAFALDDGKLKVPPILTSFIKKFEEALKQSEKASAAKKQRSILSLPSPNSTPVPRSLRI